ncbi:hypothetical protein [Gracilimonas mengyeensis]|uniref:DUF2231 domain-containing protein n=1 Tax=Gracilimonas mengyeensis TaxID=1302730 RepID=A0A521BYI8_9BACT|nr:hypothetical protein [Gracilimonas mengyeensis]SMO52214.1 hypothetical protein SAMN06265219_1044 [Gracilimonas mengyeensis]
MNAAHLHLIVNHIPIFTTLIGILILAWGMYKKEVSIRNIAFVLFIVGAASSYLAIETGESAEDIVEEVASVSHDTIHDHEEAAEISLWFAVVMGFLSIGALASRKLKLRFETGLNIAILLTALITLGLLTYTAYEGGKIRHSEAYTEVVQTSDE